MIRGAGRGPSQRGGWAISGQCYLRAGRSDADTSRLACPVGRRDRLFLGSREQGVRRHRGREGEPAAGKVSRLQCTGQDVKEQASVGVRSGQLSGAMRRQDGDTERVDDKGVRLSDGDCFCHIDSRKMLKRTEVSSRFIYGTLYSHCT